MTAPRAGPPGRDGMHRDACWRGPAKPRVEALAPAIAQYQADASGSSRPTASGRWQSSGRLGVDRGRARRRGQRLRRIAQPQRRLQTATATGVMARATAGRGKPRSSANGDMDRDGIANRYDRDRDGDGIRQRRQPMLPSTTAAHS